MSRGRRWWLRRVGSLVTLAMVALGGWYTPAALREADAFRVRHVEVVGTRFLDPYAVVRAAGLDRGASVFDDADRWRAGVRTLALVDEVRVRRLLPSRVAVEVREVEPVALVAHETLRPVDAGGRLLELDPAGSVLDLPVVTGVAVDGAAVAEGASAAAIATVAGLLQRAPGVAGRVSQAELSGSELRLTFRDARAVVVLPAETAPVQLTQLRLALADLMARGELDAVRRIDLRFRDQVVVSFLDRP